MKIDDIKELPAKYREQAEIKLNKMTGPVKLPPEMDPQNKQYIVIPLQPRTKKNSQRIVHNGKYHKILPSKAYERYQKDCAKYLEVKGYRDKPIQYPVNIKALYYMGTKHRVDLVNLHEALHDVLVHYQVLEDDNSKIIVSTDGSRVLYDKENPRTEIFIEELNL